MQERQKRLHHSEELYNIWNLEIVDVSISGSIIVPPPVPNKA